MKINAETIKKVKDAKTIELVGDYEDPKYDNQLAEAIKNNTAATSVRIKDVSSAVLRRLLYSLINQQNINTFIIDSAIASSLPDLKHISRLKHIKNLILKTNHFDSVQAIMSGARESKSIQELQIIDLNMTIAELFSELPKESSLKKIIIVNTFTTNAIQKLATINPAIVIEKDGQLIQNSSPEVLPRLENPPQKLKDNSPSTSNKTTTTSVLSTQRETQTSTSNTMIIDALKEKNKPLGDRNSSPESVKNTIKHTRPNDATLQNPNSSKKQKIDTPQMILNTVAATNPNSSQETAKIIEPNNLEKMELLKNIAITHTKIRLFTDANHKIYSELTHLQLNLSELAPLNNNNSLRSQLIFKEISAPENKLPLSNPSSHAIAASLGIPTDTFLLIESLRTAPLDEIKIKLDKLNIECKNLASQNLSYQKLYDLTHEELLSLSNSITQTTYT